MQILCMMVLLVMSNILCSVALRRLPQKWKGTPAEMEISDGVPATVSSGNRFLFKFKNPYEGRECLQKSQFDVKLSGPALISCESTGSDHCGWYASNCMPLLPGNYTLHIKLMYIDGQGLEAALSKSISAAPLNQVVVSTRLRAEPSQQSKAAQDISRPLCSSSHNMLKRGMWIATNNVSDRSDFGRGLSMEGDVWEWALPDCDLQIFHARDIESCLADVRVGVVGASHARNLYKGILSELGVSSDELKRGHRGNHTTRNMFLMDNEEFNSEAHIEIERFFRNANKGVYLFMDGTERLLQVFGQDANADKEQILNEGKWTIPNLPVFQRRHLETIRALQQSSPNMRTIYLSNVAYPDTQREQSRGFRNNFRIEDTSKRMRNAFADAGLAVPEIDGLAITLPRNDDVCVPGQNHYTCECAAGHGRSWPGMKNLCGPVGWVLNQVVLNSICN